jgi:hypothetical protein
MMAEPTEPPDSPEDNEPETIATPEGDGEDSFDQPLAPSDVEIERPRGDEPHFSLPLRDALD